MSVVQWNSISKAIFHSTAFFLKTNNTFRTKQQSLLFIVVCLCTLSGKNRVKFHPKTGHEGPGGVLDGVAVQRHTLATSHLEKQPGASFTGGWVGPKAGLGACGKSRFPPGFDPRTVEPVARRYIVRYKKNTNILYIVAVINTVWKQKGNVNFESFTPHYTENRKQGSDQFMLCPS